MAANLQNWKNAMEPVMVALSPTNDGSGLSYRFIDSLAEERGHGQHRELLWRVARSARIIAESTATVELEWAVPCELFLHRNDRTYEDFATAVEDEAVDLTLAWSRLTALGTGVWNANFDRFEVREVEPERPARAGGIPKYEVARVTFFFRVHTGEA